MGIRKVLRKRIIKKIVIIDGKPVETEEVIEEPEDVTEEITRDVPGETVTIDTICQPEITTKTVQKVLRKRIIKKIIIIDGKPVETEEVIEEPEDVTVDLTGDL